MDIDIDTVQALIGTLSNFAVNYGFQILGALIILVLGWFVAKWTSNFVLKLCQRSKLNITLSKFFADVAKTLILVFVVIIALGKFGITITPLIATLGAIAFGGTLALQGPLSNYGAGLSIILARPFVVSDTIRIKGAIGIVEEIKLAHTELISEDGEIITIPNKIIVDEIIHNSKANLVVEASICIAYDSDVSKAIAIIEGVLESNSRVVTEPRALVGIQRFAESAIELGYRYWIPTRVYYEVMYEVNKMIHDGFKQSNIVIPFPQHDVHIINQDN